MTDSLFEQPALLGSPGVRDNLCEQHRQSEDTPELAVPELAAAAAFRQRV